MTRCAAGWLVAAGLLLAAGGRAGAEPGWPSLFGRDGDLRPAGLRDRWQQLDLFQTRAELTRQMVRDRIGLISPDVFSLMGRLAPTNGRPGALARGTRLGLVAGSVGYVGGVLSHRDPLIVGAAGLAVGFGLGAFADIKLPRRLSLEWGRDGPLSFGVGWLRKPGYLPRSQPRPGGHGALGRYTAGMGLHFSPPREHDLSLDLFLDPFAGKGDSLGGFQASFCF